MIRFVMKNISEQAMEKEKNDRELERLPPDDIEMNKKDIEVIKKSYRIGIRE